MAPRAALAHDELPGASIPKYEHPLVILPAMPRSGNLKGADNRPIDYYEIAARQFQQQMLPHGFPKTTVWGYGAIKRPGTLAEGGSFHTPSLTIEASYRKRVRIRWINDLVDDAGNYLPYFLPVDQTLHWANPAGDCMEGVPRPDCHGMSAEQYTGPVPMVVHMHGADVAGFSDGLPEAWYLPDAKDLYGFFPEGSRYEENRIKALARGIGWLPGSATFDYENDQRATMLWFHDHSLGLTRANVYAGLAGAYILRGGPDDKVNGILPGPAPTRDDLPGMQYREITLIIQDRSFYTDGSLHYPARDGSGPSHAMGWGASTANALTGSGVDSPEDALAPRWIADFMGDTMVVNGRTWPYLEVEQRRYRFRVLNACNSRFLRLQMENGTPFTQIGSDGGFLPAPVQRSDVLISPSERVDLIIDFSQITPGTKITLRNLGPDVPFGLSDDPADPGTTGQVMQFRVVKNVQLETSTPPAQLGLPVIKPLGPESAIRQVGLLLRQEDGQPKDALLGTVDSSGEVIPKFWMDPVTETPRCGDTELWEIHNPTALGHPMHIHLVEFQVVERENMSTGEIQGPGPGEEGFKDTVIVNPFEIVRVKAQFQRVGSYVWHCHILEHEDNEMMRPMQVLPASSTLEAGAPMPACKQPFD
ncbi:multicopper oxidase domain-containing protein [Polyangium aurulentum]|nr:multicopper oxidase domain-containing protein [Polyangium aurulentum]